MLPGQSKLAISSVQSPRAWFAELLNLVLIQPQNADHAAVLDFGRGLHRLAPRLHDLEAMLKVHRAREDERRVFAQAQAGRRPAILDRFWVILPQFFHRCQARHKDGRLRAIRSVELFGRSLGAQLVKIVTERLRRPIKQPAGRGHFMVDGRAHPDGLGALAREQEASIRGNATFR